VTTGEGMANIVGIFFPPVRKPCAQSERPRNALVLHSTAEYLILNPLFLPAYSPQLYRYLCRSRCPAGAWAYSPDIHVRAGLHEKPTRIATPKNVSGID
jgi:hypothetical protein